MGYTTMVGTYLAIDGGRSGCRLSIDGQEPVCGPGLPPAGAGLNAVLEALDRVIPAVVPSGGLVCAGLAGLLSRPDLAPVIGAALKQRLAARRVLVTSDAVTSYAGALGTQAGVVVCAGTGAVAFGAANGDVARADGWGHLLGDAGSGFWIGREGLELALRAEDGRGGSSCLADLARRQFGPLDGVPSMVGASPVEVAAFAPAVAEAALAGDHLALQIWADAAAELAGSAAACARRLFQDNDAVPVSWSGSLFSVDPSLLLDPFFDNLAALLPSAVPVPPAGDSLAGAALLAAAVESRGVALLAPVVYDTDTASVPGEQAQ